MTLFPIQPERGAKPHPLLIPWEIAELAYSVYAAKFGTSQSLNELSRRGGFGPSEMDKFLPDWRERCDALMKVTAQRDALLSELESLVDLIEGMIEGDCAPDVHTTESTKEAMVRIMQGKP